MCVTGLATVKAGKGFGAGLAGGAMAGIMTSAVMNAGNNKKITEVHHYDKYQARPEVRTPLEDMTKSELEKHISVLEGRLKAARAILETK